MVKVFNELQMLLIYGISFVLIYDLDRKGFRDICYILLLVMKLTFIVYSSYVVTMLRY